jgi:hypothetical protein
MLAHVDPYGNTIFNRTQMSAVLEELATLQPNSTARRSAPPAR